MNKNLIKTEAEIAEMRKGGAILGKIVHEIADKVVVDMPTAEIDNLAKDLCKTNNVLSGTLGYQGYPSAISVSINDELVHGIPTTKRIIKSGDIVKLDMVIIYNGWYLDHAITLPVGDISDQGSRLIKVTKLATDEAIKQCKPKNRVGDISYTMQSIVELAGFNVAREMIGHGIGRHMHEAPEVPCYGERRSGPILMVGMTLAVETMSMAGQYFLDIDTEDGWTARTSDGSITAHFEHTIAITKNGPIILTSA